MNKKIFTLLMGVIIAFGSAFTVSAQTPTVHNKLGIPVAFADNLRTDIVKDDFSPSSTSGNKYVIRLTGLANPTQDFQPLSNIFGDFSQDYVLFVDSVGQLRLDTLGNLDSEKYDFRFNGSSKFAALRRASWCINYRTDGPASLFSNVVFNFTNMESGWDIQSPGSGVSGWEADPKGFGRRIYKPASGGLDLSNTNLVLHSWHFSQTLGISNQPLQEKMPLYTHVSEENVAVLTIDAPYITPTKDGKGGWIVTVREVFADDLIADFQGNVREGTDGVSNVLLFSLAKIQKFVLNADDYNAVADSIVFDPDAIGQTVAKNPFVRTGEGILKAFEVNDSLYRYGYLQFRQNVPGKSGWLVVDTDFVNFGNSEYLKFKFESFRRDTTFAANSKWGTEYYASGRKPIKEPVLTEIEEGIWNSSVYWRLDSLVWAVVKNLTGLGYMDESYIKDDGSIDVNKAFLKSGKEDVYKIVGGTNYNEAKTLWESIVTIGMDLRTDFSPFSNGLTLNKSGNNWTTIGGLFKNSDTIKSKGYPKAGEHYVSGHKDYNYKTDLFAAAETKYKADSALFLLNYNTDSLMENQSKFRVVYDPNENRVAINVYQTRYLYKDYSTDPSGKEPAWWTNSFKWASGIFSRPSEGWNSNAEYYTQYYDQTNIRPVNPQDGKNLFHSYMAWYPESSPKKMDKVLISTADTSVFYVNGNPLSWEYQSNRKDDNGDGNLYRDSLFYVGIQNYNGSTPNIITLVQSDRFTDFKIEIKLGGCVRPVKPGDPPSVGPTHDYHVRYVKNGLYLIRNKIGQFLAVPLWSISDSAYWITPRTGEDPRQIPAYQWVLENTNSKASEKFPTEFNLRNREFGELLLSGYLNETNGGTLHIPNARLDESYATLEYGDFKEIVNGYYDYSITYADEQTLPGSAWDRDAQTAPGLKAFIPLGKGINDDNLLGYTYIDPDSAYIDVYALKYLNFIDQRYIGWNGYANNVPANQRDTVVYVTSKDYTDKMYFSLEQMPGGSGVINLETTSGAKVKYQNVYNKYVGKKETWLNKTDLYFEEYGYKGSYAFPLIRQAYRLLLKDYYKYSPTIDGNYVTVGQQNNYIMADKMYAMNPYVENSGRVEGMFGVPYFYFRNVYFPEADPTLDATYFSLIQRVDLTDAEMQKNVKKYLKSMLALGEEAASRIVDMMHHKGIFAAFVEDYTAKLKLGVRGDNQITPSTFTLERDDDPIYRRFHVNDLLEKTKKDDPFTLEFHTVMDDKLNNLFENSGADTRTGGGWEFNLIDRFKPGLGLKKDSLGKVISFLGFKDIINFPRETNADGYPSESSNIGSLNGAEYPVKTNYAFYLDTAYINRGTGWIKPQYLIAVDTLKVGVKTFTTLPKPPFCSECEPEPVVPSAPAAQPPYLLARYLYNASMYAKEIDTDPTIVNNNYPSDWENNPYDYPLPVKAGIIHGKFGKSDVDGNAYVYDSKWDRFAFAWAIHKGDTLIVLKTTDPLVQDIVKGDPALINDKLIAQYGKEYNGVKYIDFGALRATSGKEIPEGKTFGVHALIYLGNNKHKDWVFSFRYVERGSDDFIIESETKDRNWNGTEIRPGYGGWLKWVGGVPVITRSDVVTTDEAVQASLMNVIEVKGSTAVAPVINEKVTEVSSVTVSGGKGNVTILNAGGKKIVISNILGQTIAKTVLSSDNASIAVPSGVVVVAIEGEKAVKAVVK